jgi:endonuclease/exonuclease/phosphatase (EEP) superfamily protein YafD
VALVLSTVGLAWMSTRYLGTARHRVVVPASLVPFSLVPAALGAALAVASRRLVVAVVSVLVVLAIAATQLPMYAGTATATGRPLRVLTLNMRLGSADPAQTVALARARRADVVALEEMTPEALAGLTTAGIGTDFPYALTAPRADAAGLGLFSRTPLTDTRVVGEAWTHNSDVTSLAARIGTTGSGPGPVLFVTHVPAPWPEPAGQWTAQLDALVGEAARTAGPLIIAGDFNSTFDNAPFRRFLGEARLSDAGELAGAGWMRTYPADRAFPPIIAIDHVLVRGVGAASVATFTVHGSDHRALLADLRLG